MLIKEVKFVINNGEGPDVHIRLDSILPVDTLFKAILVLTNDICIPEQFRSKTHEYLITGLRKPASDFCTVCALEIAEQAYL